MTDPRERETALVIEDNRAFGESLVTLLGELGVAATVADSQEELDQRLLACDSALTFVLIDLGLPKQSGVGEQPNRDVGKAVIESLTDKWPDLDVVAYTTSRLTPDEEEAIRDCGASYVLVLGLDDDVFPASGEGGLQTRSRLPSSVGAQLLQMRERLQQINSERLRLKQMLHDRYWAHALMDVWGVGVSVVDRHNRIVFADERHRQLASTSAARRKLSCFRAWHDYRRKCVDCSVRRAIESGEQWSGVRVDLVGSEVLYALVRAVPLRAVVEESSQTTEARAVFAAKEAVVPLRTHDPRVVAMPLRRQAGHLAHALLCATGASCITILRLEPERAAASPRSDGEPLLAEAPEAVVEVLARYGEDGPRTLPAGTFGLNPDHWATTFARPRLRSPRLLGEQREPDRLGVWLAEAEAGPVVEGHERRRRSPATMYTYCQLWDGDRPVGLVRADFPQSEVVAAMTALSGPCDPLLAELAGVIGRKGRRRHEQRAVQAEITADLEELARTCGLSRVRLYRTSEDGSWLWGYLQCGDLADFDARPFLVREDESTYDCCIIRRQAALYEGLCPRAKLNSPNRIEVPLFDDDERLFGKVAADNGEHRVTEAQLSALGQALAAVRPRWARYFRPSVAVRYIGERSRNLDWSRIQALVALAEHRDTALRELVEQLKLQVGATSAYLRYEHEGFLVLHEHARFGEMGKIVSPQIAWAESTSLSAQVYQRRTPDIYDESRPPEDWDKLHQMQEGLASAEVHRGQVAVGVFPLVGGEECLGTLAIHSNKDPQFFEPEVTQAVQEVASDIARVLRDQRLVAAARSAEHLREWETLAYEMAHQVRNPIFAQTAFIEGLRECLTGRAEELELLDDIERTRLRVEHLVTSMMDLAVRFEVQTEVFVVKESVGEAWSRVVCDLGLRPEPRLTFTGSQGLTVRADRELLGSCLEAILHNAIAHGRPPVSVAFERRAARSEPFPRMNTPYVVLLLGDSGNGVPPRLGDRIFDPFVSTRVRGSGLGLAVVRRKVTAMGGCVDQHGPAPGGGALFRIALPEATDGRR